MVVDSRFHAVSNINNCFIGTHNSSNTVSHVCYMNLYCHTHRWCPESSVTRVLYEPLLPHAQMMSRIKCHTCVIWTSTATRTDDVPNQVSHVCYMNLYCHTHRWCPESSVTRVLYEPLLPHAQMMSRIKCHTCVIWTSTDTRTDDVPNQVWLRVKVIDSVFPSVVVMLMICNLIGYMMPGVRSH